MRSGRIAVGVYLWFIVEVPLLKTFLLFFKKCTKCKLALLHFSKKTPRILFLKRGCVVFFQVAHCNVSLVDDGRYEASETFTVRLANATGEEWYGAMVGQSNKVRVTISNDEDGECEVVFVRQFQ